MDAEKCNSDGELKKSKKHSKKNHKVTKKLVAKGDLNMDEGDNDFYVSELDSSDSDASMSEDDNNVPAVSNAEVNSDIII